MQIKSRFKVQIGNFNQKKNEKTFRNNQKLKTALAITHKLISIQMTIKNHSSTYRLKLNFVDYSVLFIGTLFRRS